MTTTPFEIKVVYDATRRRRGTAVRTTAVRRAHPPGLGLIIGALLNLFVAGAMYYTVWWQADPFLYITMIKKTPFDVSPTFAANPFGFADPEDVSQPQSEPDATSDAATISGWSTKTLQIVIPTAAYGWLVLATISSCAVALAGGAWLGAIGGHWVRVAGFAGLIALMGGVAYFAYRIWSEYAMMYKPDQFRMGMGWLTLLVALLGLATAARARGVSLLAGITIMIAAIGTPVGLWLWSQGGAIDPRFASWPWLAGGFAMHAGWGLVLLIGAARIRI